MDKKRTVVDDAETMFTVFRLMLRSANVVLALDTFVWNLTNEVDSAVWSEATYVLSIPYAFELLVSLYLFWWRVRTVHCGKLCRPRENSAGDACCSAICLSPKTAEWVGKKNERFGQLITEAFLMQVIAQAVSPILEAYSPLKLWIKAALLLADAVFGIVVITTDHWRRKTVLGEEDGRPISD